MFDLINRYEFLGAAIVFEGSLIGLAWGLGRWFGIDPLAHCDWSLASLAWGSAATIPMFALFAVSYRWPLGPLRHIKRLLIETLGPSLAACRWYDLALLAAVAGISEELLFRGVLQPHLGLVASNVFFGLAHSISPLYAVLAGGMGLYLGWLLDATGNVLAPIVTHGLYDFLAFIVVARDYRRTAATNARQSAGAGQLE
jgi:membrane protease YdiL (CAAX protease family)